MSDRKRLLNELRVIDLRAELEKRNLDKSGVRGVLIQRLSKYVEDEGHDPTTYKFDLSGTEPKGTPAKRGRKSESTVEQEVDENPALDDMIVQDEASEQEGCITSTDVSQCEDSQEPKASQQLTMEEKMDVDEAVKVNRKRDSEEEESEATEAKKPCLEKENSQKPENNIDTEDSIYLDLGDDELLNEETDNTIKHKKDDAAGEDTPGNESTADESAGGTDATAADDQQVNAEAPATSSEGDRQDENQKDDKDVVDGEKKEEGKEGGARNLWVSGLSGDTRAKDLKQLCSKYGKVIGAKIVTNARTPGSRCYGYVTMAVAQDAEKCIKYLHRTELHGRMISVEKAKSESESSRRQASRADPGSGDRKDDPKDNEEGKDGDTKKDGDVSGADSPVPRSTSRCSSRARSHRSDRERARRSRERRRTPREVLTFSRIWKERDVARTRERSRAAREEDRRRRAAEEALRERERRQRQEKHRLALERVKLRDERERIEREKKELLRLERERHRLEREKLELERLELKRAQLRLEEERRKRGYEGPAYRKPVSSPPPEPAYERDPRHKRAPPPPMSSSRGPFEAPPPPRFEIGASYDRGADKRDRERDYKRDYPRHVPSSNMKYPSNGSSNDDARQPLPAGARPKEPSRSYEPRDARPYRPSPPGKPEPRSWNASRYPDAAPPSKGSSGEAWSSGEARYGAYEQRYAPAYQPPPPGAAYPDRYAPSRDYRKY